MDEMGGAVGQNYRASYRRPGAVPAGRRKLQPPSNDSQFRSKLCGQFFYRKIARLRPGNARSEGLYEQEHFPLAELISASCPITRPCRFRPNDGHDVRYARRWWAPIARRAEEVGHPRHEVKVVWTVPGLVEVVVLREVIPANAGKNQHSPEQGPR